MAHVVPSDVAKAIDNFFPSIGNKPDSFELDRMYVLQLDAILELIDHIPSELITLDGNQYVLYLACISALKAASDTLKTTVGSIRLNKLKGFGGMNPLASLYILLTRCPDEFPMQSTTELSFVTDKDLKDELRIDISVANRAIANGEWKSATVIAGSAIETLLLWVIQNQTNSTQIGIIISSLCMKDILPKKTGTATEKWNLNILIEVALELNVIREDTAIQCRLAIYWKFFSTTDFNACLAAISAMLSLVTLYNSYRALKTEKTSWIECIKYIEK